MKRTVTIEKLKHSDKGIVGDAMEAQCLEGQRRSQEEERIWREGEQRYQAYIMFKVQKYYEMQVQTHQALTLDEKRVLVQQAQAQSAVRAVAEQKAREAAQKAREAEEERVKQEEERRHLAEKQEAERIFMRKFLGGGFSSLAPEFAPM